MMRLAPTGYLRMSQTKQLEMTFGGGEANVAVSLANYGKEARFVTGLPDNDIGAACKGELRRWGVDISKIITKPGRMGIYFCEKGAFSASVKSHLRPCRLSCFQTERDGFRLG